jgi:RHS repeat-associated protein
MVTALEQPVFWKQYFDGDYKAIGGATQWNGATGLGGNYHQLYNGNISSMTVSIEALNNPLLYNYQYDQLNRLVSMDAWKKNSSWSSFTHTDDYQERVRYDPNGNILSYKRNGNTAGSKPLDMDKLAYNYKPGTNQLDHVYDTVPAGNYDVDIDAQAAANYEYDHIGNLVKDNAEGITSVSWTVYGKISRIVKNDSTKILYTYDESGNRISKTVIPPSGGQGGITWYSRDAQGNVMSVYEAGNPALHEGHLTQTELHLYGSSRLGLLRRSLRVDAIPVPDPYKITMPIFGEGDSIPFGRGNKLFELSNHLGNVLVTVNDKKLGVSSTNTTVDYFNPQVVSAQDYYPFGMLQPGRSYNAGGYRFGFNGKENDNEVKGEGNQQDYGFRIYDPRIGKFLSVDPLTKDYPWYTPYQFVGNSPDQINQRKAYRSAQSVDLDGLEPIGTNTIRSLSSLTGKIMGVASNFGYNATSHTVGLATGIAVDPDGNVLSFTQTGGLAAALDFSQAGASTDVSVGISFSISLYNNRITDLTQLLGPGQTFSAGVGLGKAGGISVGAEVTDDNKIVGATLSVGLGFGAGTPITFGFNKSKVIGAIYAKSEYDRVYNMYNQNITKTIEAVSNYNYGQAEVAAQQRGLGETVNYAHALWVADGAMTKVDYETVGDNCYEIVIRNSYRVYAQETVIPSNLDRNKYKFSSQIRTSTERTGVFLNKDADGNYISEAYQYQQNNKE